MSSLDFADDVLAPRSGIEAPERNRAVEWLREILSAVDSMPSNEMYRLAQEQGFKRTTIERARKELGIKCYIEYNDDGERLWYWKLPAADGCERKQLSLSEMLANLQKMKQSIKLPKLSSP